MDTERTVIIGKSARGGDVTVTITLHTLNTGRNNAWAWSNGQLVKVEGTPLDLSIVGDVWMRSKRDVETCGQIGDHIVSEVETFIVPREKVERLVELWDRWHLNGMRAACEHQRARGETFNTHPSAQCPDCGYKLGHAWLYEALPGEVVAELRAWPN